MQFTFFLETSQSRASDLQKILQKAISKNSKEFVNPEPPQMFICREQRIEMPLELCFSLSVIEEKFEIVAFERSPNYNK